MRILGSGSMEWRWGRAHMLVLLGLADGAGKEDHITWSMVTVNLLIASHAYCSRELCIYSVSELVSRRWLACTWLWNTPWQKVLRVLLHLWIWH